MMTHDPFAKRIEKLREALAEANAQGIVLTSEENRRYFLGFTGTDGYGLVTSDSRQMFIDSRYTEQAKEQCIGSEVVLATSGTAKRVSQEITDKGLTDLAMEDHQIPWSELLGFEKRSEGVNLIPLSHKLSAIRIQKDASEIALIREAIRIADEAFMKILPEIKVGVTEAHIAAVLEHEMRLLGASGPSFTTIVASGYRSAMPHGTASEKQLEAHDPITIDFGCIYKGYCSDATRTVFLGEPTDEMRRIYEVVLEAQETCVAALKPGMTGQAIDKVARDVINEAGYGRNFGHGLGHSLGLLVHEPPSASPGSEAVLHPGTFITVEPGVYVPGVGGVRIEDTCLITEDGSEILTNLPKELTVLPV